MKKAIGYLRVSTTSQVEDGSSLDNQAEKIKLYCQFNNIELIEIITDAGKSGRKDNRTGFVKVLDMIRKKEVDAVVVYSLSRFTRSTKTLLETIEFMKDNSVDLHSISEKLDTTTAMGKFFYTLIGSINELESNQTGERIRDVKSFNKQNKRTYSTPVYGYLNNKETKQLVPVESELFQVKRMLSLKNMGWSYSSIADELNSKEVPTKSLAKWHASTVYNIINNPLYR